MILDNRIIVTRLNKRRYITLIVYFVSLVILLLDEIIKKPIWGYEKEFFALIITIIYLIYVIYTYILNHNFFSYSDDGNKLVFRFVSLRPFDNKKRAIEINKKDFAGYGIKKSLFNLKQELIIKIYMKNGVANYPPISITAVSFKHKEMLKNSLNQMI